MGDRRHHSFLQEVIKIIQDPRTKNTIPQASNIKGYLSEYVASTQKALEQIPEAALTAAFDLLAETIKKNTRVYVGGNGGSAAISDHLCCDWTKGVAMPGKSNLKVHPLLSSPALFTAIANDYGYEHTLSYPLELWGEKGDVAVLISSSGNSPNILAAAKFAKSKGLKIIGLTGFDGGELKAMADISLHIPLHNYGMVEDSHQTLMHVLAQYLFKVRSQEK